MPIDYPELDALPADQKMTLAAQLWQEAIGTDSNAEADPEIVRILEERLAHYNDNPQSGFTWEQVKKKIQGDD